MPVPVPSIPQGTLTILLSVALTPVGLEMLIEQNTGLEHPSALPAKVAARASRDCAVAERVERVLHRVFGAGSDEPIVFAAARLRAARAAADAFMAAQALWLAARREGVAWRQFEGRARDEVVHIALQQAVQRMAPARLAAK